MPITTENFNLVYAVEGEVITPEIEENRYLTIDRQLLGVFQIFGNGVVDGWNITAGDGLSIVISSGNGITDLKYFESIVSTSIVNLSSNSTQYVYAAKITMSPADVSATFYVTDEQDDIDGAVLIAEITTNDTSVSNVNVGVRNNISFVEAALELIKNHRHFGGDNPSQIDLTKEVRGELPPENISDLDASKITTGRLSEAVVPQLSHFDLENVGTLTHTQLDSYISMLTYENSHLLGEVSSVNLLQLYMSHKHFWHNIDEYTSNLLIIIPGISSSTFTDSQATTATIDTANHKVSGVVATSGTILAKTYTTTSDFAGYSSSSNVVAASNELKLSKSDSEEHIIANFEESVQNEEEVEGFVKEITVSSASGDLKSDMDNKETGFFGGKAEISQTITLSYTKDFSIYEDWSDYDTLSISIKNTDLLHGQINCYFTNVSSSGIETDQTSITLLSQNEVTDGFKQVTVSLGGFSKDNISKLVIYTTTDLGWDVSGSFSFVLDNIKVIKESLYESLGNARYRISLPQQAQWESISWTSELNNGDIQIRARSASTAAGLTLVPFSDYVNSSGDSLGVDNNSDIEIDITFTPDSDKENSSVLTMFKITYVVAASDNGFVITDYDDWDNGTLSSKTDIDTVSGTVRIKEPISVGDIFYGNSVIVSQIDINDIPVFGYRGNVSPPAPAQLVNNNINTGYDFINSLNRLDGGNYLFCDTGNDRVIEIDPDGNFIFGFGSFEGTSDNLTVLASVYRSDLSLLTFVLSKSVSIDSIDFSYMEIRAEDETFVFSSNDAIVEDSLVDSSGNASVFNVLLSADSNAILSGSSELSLIVRSGAFSEEISDLFDISGSLMVGGLSIFIGNFIYINGINAPVAASLLDNENYIVGNSRKWGRENVGIPSILEVKSDGTTDFSFDEGDFLYTLEKQ